MVFDSWVIEHFGNRGRREAAKFFGLSPQAIYSYCALERFPSAENQEIIEIKTKGSLDLRAWRSEYLKSRVLLPNKQTNKDKKACCL